ncbi:MAG: cobalt-precorrin-6A reductase [Austwickia sp.]|nr:MAG: cobalt-precorrin-6A reductase [Austwickia sp.]
MRSPERITPQSHVPGRDRSASSLVPKLTAVSPADAVSQPPSAPSVLILGGTTEGRELAEALAADGWDVVTSLAGRTAAPVRPAGRVRTGGFGGPAGLRDWLAAHRPACVVDATHPFATGISANAAPACADAGVPLLHLRRPSWAQTHPDAAGWTWAADHADAAARARALNSDVGGAVLLAVGRQATPRYVPALVDRPVVARVAEAGDLRVPPGWRLLQSRGPFSADGERELFARERIRLVVSKDSGGAATAAKLDVAAETGAAVVMVRRPPTPPGVAAEVGDAAAARRWCAGLRGAPGR